MHYMSFIRAIAWRPGVGDLVLTCSSNLSRNYSVGHAMASNTVPEHKRLD